jgi:hypothetical protein
MRTWLFAPVLLGLLASRLPAQDNTELLNRMKAMEDRIKTLEAEVQSLKGQPAPASPAQPLAAVATPLAPAPSILQEPTPVTLGGAGPAASKALNPDISVIGDFVGAAGNGANRKILGLEMHESEVGFQEVIDPYARADFFISFGEQGVNVEEGYLTFTALPSSLQLKVGKMRAAFGKVNGLHNHVLPWVDRPLVSQDLVGGEDGIDDAGISLSRILPAPKGIFLEGVAQVFRGDSTNVFRAATRSDVSAIGHLHAYADLSESTNIDIGGSYARGHSPYADGRNQLFGAASLSGRVPRSTPPARDRLSCAPPSPSPSDTTSPATTNSPAAGSWVVASTAPSAARASPPTRTPNPATCRCLPLRCCRIPAGPSF